MAFFDSFSSGCYRFVSPSGKQSIDIDHSDRFGPTRVNMRDGSLAEIPDKHWIWAIYKPWVEAGRPTEGRPMSSPNGPLMRAKYDPPKGESQ